MFQCDDNHDEIAHQVVVDSGYLKPDIIDNNGGEVSPDYDLPEDLNDSVYDSNNNQNNDDVRPYSFDTYENIDDVQFDMSDVLNNSDSILNKNEIISTVDFEVDDILRLLYEKENDDNSSVMSVEIIPNTNSAN